MIRLPEVLMVKVLYNLNEKDVIKFFISSQEEALKKEYLKNTKEYLLKTQDIDWKKPDKAILFFKLAKSEDITPQDIVKIINGFNLDNGASKVQVLKALASNKELFKTLSPEHKEEIVNFVIFPMGMSPQEEENNEPEVDRNQKKIAEILGISAVFNAVTVSIGCGSKCVIS